MVKLFTRILITLLLMTASTAVAGAYDAYCPDVKIIQVAARSDTLGNAVYELLLETSHDECGDWVNGTRRWFKLNKNNGAGMYATVLTAMAMSKDIIISPTIPATYTNGTTIYKINIKN